MRCTLCCNQFNLDHTGVLCKGCQAVGYCSVECEKEDAVAHKRSCPNHKILRETAHTGNTLLRSGYPEKALLEYTRQLEIAGELQAHTAEGRAHCNMGIALDSMGRSEEANEHWKSALRIARKENDRLGEARALGNMGLSCLEQGHTDDALSYLTQNLYVAEELNDISFEVRCHANLCDAYLLAGNYDQVMEHATQWFYLCPQPQDPLDEAKVRRVVGEAMRRQFRFRDALSQLWSALQTVDHERQPPSLLKCQVHHSIAMCLVAVYRTQEAMDHFAQARSFMLSQNDNKAHWVIACEEARARLRSGQVDEALAICRKAVPVFETSGDSIVLSCCFAQFAHLLVLAGSVLEGMNLCNKALALLPSFSAPLAHHQVQCDVAAALSLMAQHHQAIAHLLTALNLCRAHKLADCLGPVHLQLAYQYFMMGLPAQSEKEYRHALSSAEACGDEDTVAIAGEQLGNLLLLHGDAASALPLLDASLTAWKRLECDNQVCRVRATMSHAQRGAATDEVQLAVANATRDKALRAPKAHRAQAEELILCYDAMLALVAAREKFGVRKLHNTELVERAVSLCRNWADHVRQGNNKERIAESRIALGEALLLAQRFGEADSLLQSAMTSLALIRYHSGSDGRVRVPHVSLYETALRLLQFIVLSNASSIESQVLALSYSESARHRLLLRHLPADEPFNWPAVQEYVAAVNAPIVQFSIIEEDSLLFTWIVFPNGQLQFRKVEMSSVLKPLRKSFKQLVMDARLSLGVVSDHERMYDGRACTPNLPSTQKTFRALWQLLVLPLAKWFPKLNSSDFLISATVHSTERLVLVPHGPMVLVPWYYLYHPDFETKHLCEILSIEFLPSLSSGATAFSRKKTSESGERDVLKILLLGNASNLTDGSLQVADCTKEFDAIKSVFEGHNFNEISGDNVCARVVEDNLGSADIIHCALVNLVEGLAIQCSLDPLKPRVGDGYLSYYEMLSVSLSARLVVLTSCVSLNKETNGDDLNMLARLWFKAGAQAVVLCVWPLPREVAARYISRLYKSLKETKFCCGRSVRDVCAETMAATTDAFEWAGWVVFGPDLGR